ncbi:MAG: hypothetical protein M3P24_05280 [Gemmatimonadota bacterium]|nr:hypothetical protein [Gemmatimonadota bacterium]
MLARLSEFLQATFARRAEHGSPGAERLAAMFVAWDATRSGGEPLDSDHLGVSLEALEIEGSGHLYQISCGRRGDRSGLPAVAVQPLSQASNEPGGDACHRTGPRARSSTII